MLDAGAVSVRTIRTMEVAKMRVHVLLLAGATLSACGLHHPASPTWTDPNVITAEEIEASHEPVMYDVIARLHGEYLRDRGATSVFGSDRDVASVFLNQQAYGPLSTLKSLASSDFEMVRYWPGHDAVIKFGKLYGGGVIQVISRVEGPPDRDPKE
jgi:hypothetical protein